MLRSYLFATVEERKKRTLMDVPAILGLLLGVFGGRDLPDQYMSSGPANGTNARGGMHGLGNASYGMGLSQQASGLRALLLSLLNAGNELGFGSLGAAGTPNGTNRTHSGMVLPPFQIYASGCGEFGFYLPGFDRNGLSENKTIFNSSRYGPSSHHNGGVPTTPPNGTFTIYKSGCGQFRLPHTQIFGLWENGSVGSGGGAIDESKGKRKSGYGPFGMGVAQKAPDFITLLLTLLGATQRIGSLSATNGTLNDNNKTHGPRNASDRMASGQQAPDLIKLLLTLLGATQDADNGTSNGSNGELGPGNTIYGVGVGQQASGLPALLLSLFGTGSLKGTGFSGPAGTANKTNKGFRLPPFIMHASGCGEFGFYFPGLDTNRPSNETYERSGNGGDAPLGLPNGTLVLYKSGCEQFHPSHTKESDKPIVTQEASRSKTTVPPTTPKTPATTTTSSTTKTTTPKTTTTTPMTTTPTTTTTTTTRTTTTTTPTTTTTTPTTTTRTPTTTTSTPTTTTTTPRTTVAPTIPTSTRAPWPRANCANIRLDNGLRQVFLDTHNNLRGKLAKGQTESSQGWGIAPPASLMYRMIYSCDAESFAQQEANACKILPDHTHPGYKANHHFISTANIDKMGAARKAMQKWWSELAQFGMKSSMVFGASEFQRGARRITRWSKMAWWSNKHLGCAMQNCGGQFFTVCMYKPGGNNSNGRVYSVGAVCSGCPAGKCDGQALCRW